MTVAPVLIATYHGYPTRGYGIFFMVHVDVHIAMEHESSHGIVNMVIREGTQTLNLLMGYKKLHWQAFSISIGIPSAL